MRLLVLILALVAPTCVFAQKTPVGTDPGSRLKNSSVTQWQFAEYTAHIMKCFRGQPGRLQNKVALAVTVGGDGMIVGDPEVVSPVDSDEFRADVETALKQLRGCQPYIVDPFRRNKSGFKQVFKFGPVDPQESLEPKESIFAPIKANFDKCFKRPKSGPTIRVDLSYKPDGTYWRLPLLINPEKTEEYSRMAADVLGQINRCPPVKFPKDADTERIRSIGFIFSSYEGDSASKKK